MDSKLKRTVILLSTLTVLLVVAVVIISNGKKITGREKNTKSSEAEVSVSIDSKTGERQIGNNLNAWRNDETFFDNEADTLAAKIMEEMITLDIKCVSIEEDIRVRVLDYEGKLKTGIPFQVVIARGSSESLYIDSDQDGVIYQDGLSEGEYQVYLLPVDGYIVPEKQINVSVPKSVQYSPIEDIELLMVEKSEAERTLDDLMVVTADSYADKKQTNAFCKDDFMYGIDVKEDYGEIDWNAVYDSGIRFVMLRAGYRGAISGDIVPDEEFSEYATQASRAGLEVGAYFFSQAVNEVEAVEEASAVLKWCKNKNIRYPIAVRVDQAGGLGRADSLESGERTKIVEAFLKTVASQGYEPCLYASSNWLRTNLDSEKLGKYTIWMAQFNKTPTDEFYYDMWQYTSKGNVPGVEGNVSISRSYK